MANISEVMKKYNNMSYNELLERARADFELLVPLFSRLDKNGNGKPYVVIFMGSALAADGKFSPIEYTFVNDLFSITYDQAYSLVVKHIGERAQNISDKIFDMCNESLKEVLLDFCLCFLAVDNSISHEETQFIARLLA